MNAKPKTVLIVDDESGVTAYLSALLQDNGYKTITAGNGKEGFDKAKQEMPDLISLDITMPEESGVRMFRNLQENSETTKIPVIIVTGIASGFKGFIESRRQVRPPEGYFDKPIDNEEYIAKVKELIGD
jgi:CheY-like chemotaxis protein